ncbi:MAG: hypothetical protein ACO38P_10505, partial [Phycisphaerales bacterium]
MSRERGVHEATGAIEGPVEVWNARLRGDLSVTDESPAVGEAWCSSDGACLAATLDTRAATSFLESGELGE